ncbi:hypothetical protein M0R04_15375 [Candidatus Dojkabacteria bacterium]|jgi:hypothetical protein|nr:hypothetical protein [Candidatus Dojkabacteria bacterium]
MSLDYKSSITFPVFGSVVRAYLDDNATIETATRTAVNLTASYETESTTVATKHFETSGYSKLNLDILYTMGATETSNSIEIKVEGSPDGINFYRIPNDSPSAGTSTLTAREFTFVGTNADAATISIGLDIFYKYMRVSAKETGKVTNFGTVYAEATLLGL